MGVAVTAALVALTPVVSWRLDLGLHRVIFLSSTRSVVQLLATGLLLVPALRPDAHLAWAWSGTMTGILLAGADPINAVMTQVVVTFLVLGAITVTVATVVLGCSLSTVGAGRLSTRPSR